MLNSKLITYILNILLKNFKKGSYTVSRLADSIGMKIGDIEIFDKFVC